MSSFIVLLSSFVAASTVTILKWFHKENLVKKGQMLSAQPKQLHYYYYYHHLRHYQEQEQQQQKQQKQNHNQHHYQHYHHHQQQQQQYNRHYTEKHYSYYYYHQNHRMNNGKHCCRINLTTVLLILCLITRIACGQEMGNIMLETSNIIESFEDRQHEYGLVDGYVNFGHGNSDSNYIYSHQHQHDHDGHVAAMAEMTKHGTRRSGSRNRGEVMTGSGLVPGSRTPYTTVPTTTVLTTTRRFKTSTTAISTTTTTTTTWTTTTPIITDDMLSTMISTFLNASDNSSVNSAVIRNGTAEQEPPGLRYSIPQMVILAIVASILSILTVAGNVMVMISFKIDKQLQTISNYFLFSLAIADFAIGLISMPLFTVTTILGYWPLGPYICDTWLALDYLASNASVLNLLIISFDRYFSVTRPLTYRAKRTTSRAAIMIGAAWGISLLLWPPWIYSWPYIEGKRTVPEYECYIQFIETNHYITFGTAIAAFYVPVTVMCFLYYRIWRETKKRQKDLPNLQAGKKDSSKRSNSSDENTAVNHSNVISVTQMAGIVGAGIGGGGGGIVGASNNNTSGGDPSSTDGTSGWRRPRSESSADAESVYLTNAVMSDSGYAHGLHSRRSSTATTGHQTGGGAGHHHLGLNRTNSGHNNCYGGIKEWCIAWWHSGREDSDGDYGYDAEEPSDLGYATPVSIETPLQSSVSRCTSMNVIRDPYAQGGRTGLVSIIPDVSPTPIRPPLAPLSQLQDMGPRDSRSLPNSNRLGSRSVSQDSVYTILIRLPPDGGTEGDRAPSIKMIQDDVPLPVMTVPPRRPLPSRDSEYSLPLTRRASHAPDIRIPLNAKIIPKPLAKPQPAPRITKKKKKSQEKRQETKAAKTLSAILLSFIITWTPYNILVLLKPLTACTKCIPQELWDFFYALCYINSTINPVCYALCNASFRRTYVRILTCKWHTRNREAMTRGVYN